VQALPDRTVKNIAAFMHKLCRMHSEARVRNMRGLATAVQDQRRSEGRTDPRDTT